MASIAEILSSQIIDGEVQVSRSNHEDLNDDFESYIGLLDGERDEKEYDWMSNIRIPEFASHMLTQSAIDAAQGFSTRDFVEVKVEDNSDPAGTSAAAAKELINRTLNKRELRHYLKYMRARLINNLAGRVYLKCNWIQETEEIDDQRISVSESSVDVFGESIVSDEQTPDLIFETEDIKREVPVEDRFNYEVWDQRNVFTDNSYVYSLQDKRFITFLAPLTREQLEAQKEINGYFDLDKLPAPPTKTLAEAETFGGDDSGQKDFAPETSKTSKPFDVYERHGKYWTIVDGGKAKPGIDETGEVLESAEYVEVVITIVVSDNKRTLIGYKLQPYIDANGKPYRPVLRGLAYIHPTEDGGIGDGLYARDTQTGIDDTFNVSQDRTMLSTMPMFKGKKYAVDDNTDIFWKPNHLIGLEDVNDLVEMKVEDNTIAALNQLSLLRSIMRQTDATQPPDLGQSGDFASTTATASALAQQGGNTRSNYKAITFEYTALTEMYWMIQQMTWQFAFPETKIKLMGDKALDFNPQLEYFYKPVTQAIETEQSKVMKRKEWVTVLGYIIQIPHPDTPKLLNIVLGEILNLMGGEFENFAGKIFDESKPIQQGGPGGQAQPGAQGTPVSNQSGVEQSLGEQITREGAGG